MSKKVNQPSKDCLKSAANASLVVDSTMIVCIQQSSNGKKKKKKKKKKRKEKEGKI